MQIRTPSPSRSRAQRGIVAVEFAIGSLFFFALVFGLLELARAIYLWNTVAHVTRTAARGAAMADINSDAALGAVSRAAMFGNGSIPLAPALTAANLRYSYLRADGSETARICPTENVRNCAADPRGVNCIRMIQVRLCEPGGDACTPVPYAALVPLLSAFPSGTFNFPSFSSVTPVGSLGRNPNTPSTCP
ncbi:MAG: TadE/TadG family type IV pilus assembly protein [Telluria sp.]